jgi:hypothetical protein
MTASSAGATDLPQHTGGLLAGRITQGVDAQPDPGLQAGGQAGQLGVWIPQVRGPHAGQGNKQRWLNRCL